MAKIYEEFKVIDIDESTGHMLLEWREKDDPSKTVTRNHRIPLEAEEAGWDEETLRAYFVAEVEDMADVPAWAKAEALAEMTARRNLEA